MRPPKRYRRDLDASERALWQAVTKKITPLAKPASSGIPASQRLETEKPAKKTHRARKSLKPSPPAAAPPPPSQSRIDAGDPKMGRRVARGRHDIAATLDLHGLTQDQAYQRLVHFIEFAAARGDRTLLIITGKGVPGAKPAPFDPAPRGILRQRFLEWVDQPPLRDRIASVQASHQKHGGRGAFYVFLKSRQKAL